MLDLIQREPAAFELWLLCAAAAIAVGLIFSIPLGVAIIFAWPVWWGGWHARGLKESR